MSGFLRGPGPLVSVLIPTRGRKDWLLQAIDSLWSLAHDQKWLELVLKVDDDDAETIEVAKRLPIPVKMIVSPRGNGYLDMHLWVNQMAAVAEGDWLFLFNDDARMATEKWDWLLYHTELDKSWHKNPDVCLLAAQTEGAPFNTEFVILRRKTFDIIGHFALGPHNDTWIWQVMKFCGSAYYCPLIVQHFQGKIDNDATWDEGHVHRLVTGPAFNSVESIRQRMEDVGKVVDYLEKGTFDVPIKVGKKSKNWLRRLLSKQSGR